MCSGSAGICAERVLESQFTVQPCLEIGAVNGHLQFVPLRSIQHEFLVAIAELDVPPDPVAIESPERYVVLGVVVTNSQPVAIRFDIEQDAGTAIGFATDRFELQAD